MSWFQRKFVRRRELLNGISRMMIDTALRALINELVSRLF